MSRTCAVRSSARYEHMLDVNLGDFHFGHGSIFGQNRSAELVYRYVLIYLYVSDFDLRVSFWRLYTFSCHLPERKITVAASITIAQLVLKSLTHSQCPDNKSCHPQKVNDFQTMILQRDLPGFDLGDKSVHRYTHLKVVQQLLCHLATFAMTTHRGGNYSLQTNVDIFGSTLFSPCGMCVMGKGYFLGKSGFMSKIFCCSMSLLPHFTTHLCQYVWIHYLLLASPASNLHDECTILPWRKRRYILRNVWNYLPGDTASHSKQHASWKITWLKKSSFQLFLSRFLGNSLNFPSDQLIQETSWIYQTYLFLYSLRNTQNIKVKLLFTRN